MTREKGVSRPLVGAVLALAICLIVGSFFLDATVRSWVLGAEVDWLKQTARWVSKLLDWPGLMVLALLALFVAKARGNRRLTKVLLAMIIASTLAGILANASRLTTGRTRPRTENVEQGWYGPFHEGKLLIGKSAFNSFPSGHTATAIGFVAVLFFTGGGFLPRVVIVFAGLLVGWSRIQLGAHHFSDVVTASLLGVVVAAWVWWKWQEVLERWSSAWLAWKVPWPSKP